VGGLILTTVPVILAIAVKTSEPSGGDDGTPFLDQITGNGLFVALAALVLEMPLFLPIAVAAIAGDSLAGEANLGTLRYLLAVPVARTRLLLVKLGGIAVFTVAAVLLVAGVGGVLGLALFGGGPLVTLSGSTLPFTAGLGRVLLVCAYVALCMVSLGAIGLFVSALTEQPIAATTATLVIALASQIMDVIPQLSAIQPYLPTHYWLAFGDLLRDPIGFDAVGPGVASALAYLVIFTAGAWARFSGRDVGA
jgi:ABC-2 type transport system permease protein